MIDLRSDTITQPTPAMRQVMAAAAVGDDVFGDDPTVIALEKRSAEILGLPWLVAEDDRRRRFSAQFLVWSRRRESTTLDESKGVCR